MKIPCTSCGVHFPEELHQTFKRTCKFWSDLELGPLPVKYKKKVWEWIFALNTDEIYLKTNTIIQLSLRGRKLPKAKKFADIPEYRKLSEPDRRSFQKLYAKAKELNL